MSTEVVTTFLQEGVIQATWNNLQAAEDGAAASLSKWPNKSVQVVGGTIDIEGSNDGVVWAPLNDPFGAALTTLVNGSINGIAENTKFIRPANASAALVVTIIGS